MLQHIVKVSKFLKMAGVFHLSTVDGTRPRCRPLGFHLLRNGKIYFMLTNIKDVYHQMKRAPRVEITACKGKVWLRYYGDAVFDQSFTMLLLAASPSLREQYGEHAESSLKVFYLKNATAEFRVMSSLRERFTLNVEEGIAEDDAVYKRHLTNEKLLKRHIAAGQFYLHFQPQYDLKMRYPVGAEALVRFTDEQGTTLSPGVFVPALEDARLIHLLDFYAFECVCAKLVEWRRKGYAPLPISVNFSRHTVERDGFVEKIARVCSRHDIPRELLELEFTETVEADDHSAFGHAARKLHHRNFRIAIDDFGVSNANMLLLTKIDFHVLKIDKHVIDSITLRSKVRELVAALVDVCHKLGAKVIAEGVETREQMLVLNDIGCDIVQGYYCSKPLPENLFVETCLRRAE